MNERLNSVFREYYADKPFIDRFATQPTGAVDIIIPVIHTNELWEANLLSFYREAPVHKLLIGDGGCIDDSIEIAQKFPRVQVLDHRNFKSLGYSIRKLIEAVETEWFIYIHSDAYMPPGWFDAMQKHQTEYDWFGCPMQHTVMVEYNNEYGVRPWAGSQMGRKRVFESDLDRVDDDYVYRQEDFVFADIVKRGGGKEGRVTDTFHYHQTMYKASPWARKVKSVKINVELSREENIRTWTMQARGIIKYLDPTSSYLIRDVQYGVFHLMEMNELDLNEFRQWVKETNANWLPYLSPWRLLRRRILGFLRAAYRMLFR